MTRYVIDAVTLLHLVDRDSLVDPAHKLVAPNRVRSDALELLLGDVRRGDRSEHEALAAHERVTELKMRLLGDRASRGLAWGMALEHDWDTLRDAEYLAVTRLQADALVSMDAALTERAHGLVPMAPLTDLFALG